MVRWRATAVLSDPVIQGVDRAGAGLAGVLVQAAASLHTLHFAVPLHAAVTLPAGISMCVDSSTTPADDDGGRATGGVAVMVREVRVVLLEGDLTCFAGVVCFRLWQARRQDISLGRCSRCSRVWVESVAWTDILTRLGAWDVAWSGWSECLPPATMQLLSLSFTWARMLPGNGPSEAGVMSRREAFQQDSVGSGWKRPPV